MNTKRDRIRAPRYTREFRTTTRGREYIIIRSDYVIKPTVIRRWFVNVARLMSANRFISTPKTLMIRNGGVPAPRTTRLEVFLLFCSRRPRDLVVRVVTLFFNKSNRFSVKTKRKKKKNVCRSLRRTGARRPLAIYYIVFSTSPRVFMR